ncbi:response regulator [Vibrio sp. Of7-15]|uniref:response regulator n=1 Tax=Vibrio sp. Of7-15 TaxID=2724879 RepID=UPI001EF3D172|nr:response regulator [Vibrio sp. Of7-15]MCG7496394.1 response regulator [Vibrio sp. Of7-15]
MAALHKPYSLLWIKYLAILSIVTVGLSFTAGEVVREYETRYLESKVESQLERHFSALSSIAIEDVLTEDIPRLETIVDQVVMHTPDIQYILICNEDKKHLVAWGEKPEQAPPSMAVYQNKIALENEIFGYMKIGISKTPFFKDIAQHVEQIRYFSAISLLLLGVLCYFVSQYLFLSPLDKINKKLLSIHDLPLPKKVSHSASSELEVLSCSVDLLQDALILQKQKEAQLKLAKQKAEAANKMKTEFIATMSHEIRTPMNVILGSLEIMKDEPLNNNSQQFTDTALNAAKVLLNQLNDILDYSRLDSGKTGLAKESFSPVQTSQDVIAIFSQQAEEKGVALSLKTDLNTDLNVLGDVGKVSQVLTNLIGNAIKFTEQGSILVEMSGETTAEHSAITFMIKDSGIGIEKEKVATIHHPFVQSDPSFSRRYGGAGMGLAISHELISLMGGSLHISSELGEGSEFTFTITFPVAVPTVELSTTDLPIDKEHRESTILLVEDSPSNQLIAKTMLSRSGYKVETANNGLEALKAVRKAQYSLILMDLQMPEMNGLDACKAIRQLKDEKADVPIIAMTANVSDSDRKECALVGMDDFLTKPINKGKMLNVINHWFDRHHHQNGMVNLSL